VAASKSQGVKMQRIIAHLQAEHAALNNALEEATAERNVLREELDKYHNQDAAEEQLAETAESAEILRQQLESCVEERDALAKYARHLETRLGIGVKQVATTTTRASPSSNRQIHISKRGSVHISS